MKDQRLQGSDLYVARLRWKETDDVPLSDEDEKHAKSKQADGEALDEMKTRDDGDSPPSQPRTGSLHDELRWKKPKENESKAQSSRPQSGKPMATQSRPCYRCVSYMHSAGVKRVFWTNVKGEWEGAKTQELVDVLEGLGPLAGNGTGDGSNDSAMFVTKYEVLMLRKALAKSALG